MTTTAAPPSRPIDVGHPAAGLVPAIRMHCADCQVEWHSLAGVNCWICGKRGNDRELEPYMNCRVMVPIYLRADELLPGLEYV